MGRGAVQNVRVLKCRSQAPAASRGAAGWKGPKEGWLALGTQHSGIQGSCVFALTSAQVIALLCIVRHWAEPHPSAGNTEDST